MKETEFPRLGHYISQNTSEGWHPPSLPFPFNPIFNEIEVNLYSVSALLQRIQIRRGYHTNTTNNIDVLVQIE